ncbi:MAG TPA: serine hydrolase domain-containing protein [Povalibacter sp.]|uniref:serine hydrolase domain-containing protein n=1 Tax=Povalibacter sp. TaxID=1962978 RepID=UPI002CC4FD5E|nr:serine hydrolase domain-containing protein [Povalibacter sp.]HMN45906.1 serine hydrolase domain-containing protein [Povalibacter sp.]
MRPLRFAAFAGLILFLSACSAAAPRAESTRSATTAASGISQERLRRLDGLLQQYVDENRIAGAVVRILQDGQPVYDRAAGWRDRESRQPMANDTLFRIASQSKAITSTAALILMEEGRLALADPVGRYIPEFTQTTVAVQDEQGKVSIVPAKRPITIRDLMTHTAGISYGREPTIAAQYEAKGLGPAAGNGWYTADKDEPICDTMARLGTLPFVSQPGEAWVYGYNTDVLGCVVERAAGMPLDRFIRTRITDPLGMKDTFFFVPREQAGRLATLYGSGADGFIVRAPEGSKGQGHYVDGPRRSFAGGAGLVSTANDYGRFLEMIRNDGALDGTRLLSPRSVALMRTNQIGALYRTPGQGFGLAFDTVETFGAADLAAPGNFGWGGAYGSLYRVDPQAHLTIVLMIQLMPNQTDFRERFLNVVYQSILDPVRL